MLKNEIAFRNHDNGLKVAKTLLDEDYVVLLSYEEELLIVNYEWSENGADRNDIVFMRRDEYEEELDNHYNVYECPERGLYYQSESNFCANCGADMRASMKRGE